MVNKHNCKLNPFPYAYIFYECHRGAQQQLTAIFAYLNSLSQTKLALWIFLDVRWSVTLGTANCLIKGTIKSGNKVRPHAMKIVTFGAWEEGLSPKYFSAGKGKQWGGSYRRGNFLAKVPAMQSDQLGEIRARDIPTTLDQVQGSQRNKKPQPSSEMDSAKTS